MTGVAQFGAVILVVDYKVLDWQVLYISRNSRISNRTVVNVLALKGLIGGGKGATVSGIGRNVAGASKLKNHYDTAALAASLLLPSLANAGQGGDKRRQEFVRKNLKVNKQLTNPM